MSISFWVCAAVLHVAGDLLHHRMAFIGFTTEDARNEFLCLWGNKDNNPIELALEVSEGWYICAPALCSPAI